MTWRCRLFPPVWIPQQLLFSNYVEVWNAAPFGTFYINSIITTFSGLILEVIIGSLSAYAFARIEFPHRDTLFLVVLATMMIPGEIALVPNFITLKNLDWINTYQGMVIPYVSSAFGCFLLRQAFLGLSQDFFDAAKIDGAGHLRIFFNIAMPMVRPVVATFALFLFISKWNAYLWPLIVTNTWSMRTLPIGLVMVREAEGTNLGWQHHMAASLFVLAADPDRLLYRPEAVDRRDCPGWDQGLIEERRNYHSSTRSSVFKPNLSGRKM